MLYENKNYHKNTFKLNGYIKKLPTVFFISNMIVLSFLLIRFVPALYKVNEMNYEAIISNRLGNFSAIFGQLNELSKVILLKIGNFGLQSASALFNRFSSE